MKGVQESISYFGCRRAPAVFPRSHGVRCHDHWRQWQRVRSIACERGNKRCERSARSCLQYEMSYRDPPDSCARADRAGLFNCPHTGVALAALGKLVGRGDVKKSDRVVVVSTAHGLKFVDFKVRYHEMKLQGAGSEYANPPIELPAKYTAVRDEMLRQIEQRFPG